jgi:hypothetical protein
MKKLFAVPIVTVLALMLCFSGVVHAQESETMLPDPGITPDSPFYFLDGWGKQISLAFTFRAESRVQKALRYADERLAEMDAMMAQNKTQAATRAAAGYQNYLEIAARNMEQARLKSVDASEGAALMAERHLGYLCEVAGNVSGDARMLVTQIRERAMTCQENALMNMARGDPEKAARFTLQLMERQLNRIRTQAEEPETEGLRNRVEVYNRLGNLGEEISQLASTSDEGRIVDQLVGLATAHHLEVLAEVHQRVHGEAQQAVQAAIQNRVQAHEQLVARLQAKNQLGQVPAEVPMPGHMWQNGPFGGPQNGR